MSDQTEDGDGDSDIDEDSNRDRLLFIAQLDTMKMAYLA